MAANESMSAPTWIPTGLTLSRSTLNLVTASVSATPSGCRSLARSHRLDFHYIECHNSTYYMYIRHQEKLLKKHFQTYKQALILLGARQVGKTTLLKKIFPQAKYFLMDNDNIRRILNQYDIHTYLPLIGSAKELILDELHLLDNPGRSLKIIYDQIPGLKLIVTGSSSLHIKNKTGESMAGRKIDYHLYPLTFSEYLVQTGITTKLDTNMLDHLLSTHKRPSTYPFDPKQLVQTILLYGLYPEMINLPQNSAYLKNLGESVVFQDLLELNLIDNKKKAQELLKLLAYQIGSLISYAELGNKLGIDQRTVQRYIDIFEDSYIIFRLYPYTRRIRNEIVKNPKIYFWDVGLRNAVINNFDELASRLDTGALFENFIIAEIKKLNSYQGDPYQINYWRTKSGAELDLVLSNNQKLIGCEIKLTKGTVSSGFTNRYPNAQTKLITLDNFY